MLINKLILLFFLFSFKVIASNNIIASIDNIAITSYDLKNFKNLVNTNNDLNDYILLLKKRLIALKNNITITEEEKKYLQNNKEILKLNKMNYTNINKNFVDFILESNYLWTKYIETIIKPTINIDNNYVYNTIEFLDKNNIKISYNLLEIVNNEDKINFIYKKLNKNNFEKIAKEYSLSLSAKNGGNIGWFSENDLNENLIKQIKNLQIDDFTKPICNNGTCSIFKIKDKKETIEANEETIEQIKNFLLIQLLESKINYELNNNKFNIKYY